MENMMYNYSDIKAYWSKFINDYTNEASSEAISSIKETQFKSEFFIRTDVF